MSNNYSWRLPEDLINCLGIFDMIITDYNPEQLWRGRVLVHCLHKKDIQLKSKMVDYKNGLIIVYNQTETKLFQQLLLNANSMFVIKGRLRFVNEKSGMTYDNAPGGNIIFSFSEPDNGALKKSGLKGVYVPLMI